MKYTITFEKECPIELGDYIYKFNTQEIDYSEIRIGEIKFLPDKWWEFVYKEEQYWREAYYSSDFFPSQENEEYYKRPLNRISHHHLFYTKEWAELQKAFRIKYYHWNIDKQIEEKLKEIEELKEKKEKLGLLIK